MAKIFLKEFAFEFLSELTDVCSGNDMGQVNI